MTENYYYHSSYYFCRKAMCSFNAHPSKHMQIRMVVQENGADRFCSDITTEGHAQTFWGHILKIKKGTLYLWLEKKEIQLLQPHRHI